MHVCVSSVTADSSLYSAGTEEKEDVTGTTPACACQQHHLIRRDSQRSTARSTVRNKQVLQAACVRACMGCLCPLTGVIHCVWVCVSCLVCGKSVLIFMHVNKLM